ncbi:MAG: PKD repeat protein [Limisphaerales bacterium]|jgi:PKD repeat protein
MNRIFTSALCRTMLVLLLTVTGGLIVQAQSSLQPLDEKARLERLEGLTPVQINAKVVDASVPFAAPAFYHQRAATAGLSGENIGTSTYDLQTNHTSKNRLFVRSDGKISAVWTGSTEASAAYGDRGAFYNHFDGTSWGTFPTSRIELLRTGWPVLVNNGTNDIIFSHDFGSPDGGMVMHESPTGGSSWTETISSGGILKGIWPQAYHEEGSSYIHLTTSNYLGATGNNFTLYHRSPDGGATWDILSGRLPGMDTVGGYNLVGADNTTITAKGNSVAIVSASSVNDLAVWRSDANGDNGTWTRTRILEFPIANFDGNEITDIDGDLYADQVESHDGAHAVLIDNAGMMHVWAGYMVITDETPSDNSWSFFPGVTGFWYWNESFGADSVQYYPTDIDWNLSGDPIDGIGANTPNYNGCSNSHFGVAHDPLTDDMYLVIPIMVESTDIFDDPSNPGAQSFRDLFGLKSSDGGATWSFPVNLTGDAMEEFESTYPMVGATTVGDKVHVMYMRDGEPGIAVLGDMDPISENAMVYNGYDFSAFEPEAAYPESNFNSSISDNDVDFTNLSENGVEFVWDFGDGELSNGENPSHLYAAIGVYNVCLTATNIYGDNSYCEDVEVTSVLSGLDAISLDRNVKLYPNPASTFVTLDWNEQIYGLLDLQILDVTGRLLTESTKLSSGGQLDISNLNPGMYRVQINTEYATLSRNLVIQ